MSHRALYYPEWGIADPSFLFDVLLYWDSLTCIVPIEQFRPTANWPREVRSEMGALHEAYVHGWAPTKQEKDAVEKRLTWLAESDPPAWCRPENLQPKQAVVVSAYKFPTRTLEPDRV